MGDAPVRKRELLECRKAACASLMKYRFPGRYFFFAWASIALSLGFKMRTAFIIKMLENSCDVSMQAERYLSGGAGALQDRNV